MQKIVRISEITNGFVVENRMMNKIVFCKTLEDVQTALKSIFESVGDKK